MADVDPMDRPFLPEGDEDCPNEECYRGQVDTGGAWEDCATCGGEGTFPVSVAAITPRDNGTTLTDRGV